MVLVRLLWVAWGPSYDQFGDFTAWDDLSIAVIYSFRKDIKGGIWNIRVWSSCRKAYTAAVLCFKQYIGRRSARKVFIFMCLCCFKPQDGYTVFGPVIGTIFHVFNFLGRLGAELWPKMFWKISKQMVLLMKTFNSSKQAWFERLGRPDPVNQLGNEA